ncbi:MAG: S8 family peptidase [Planctomycetes bacterium]|nr:S8 family peptidase [Planctomycetota bacterium]
MSVRRQDIRFGRPIRYRLPPFRVAAAYTQLSETVDWGLALLRVPEQWRLTRGAGIRVAVLDTGIEASHPDLVGAIDQVRDFTATARSPGSAVAADRVGHGTHTAGVIGARQNDRGVVGVAPECRLLIGKVLGDDGAGADDFVAAGIDWAVATGADVLSLSLGSPTPSNAIAAAVARAVAAGRFVVCAAGNDGRDRSVNYPARLDDVVAVGAVDRRGQLADFSSRGPEVDVCAPGQEILSTYLNAGYARLSGTSMAAPFVAGLAALVLAKHKARGGDTPVTSPAELLEHLRRTATDAGPAGRDDGYGFGLVDPTRLLADAAAPTTGDRCEIGTVSLNGRSGKFVFVPNASSI